MSPRRDTVLAALKTAGEVGVSGEKLAQDIGISRAAVGKHVASLRKLGYVIEAHPGRGYVLTSVPDLPLAEEVAPLLATRLWSDLIGCECTGSTNDDAKRLARQGAAHGTVVLAMRQQTGRGRLGRVWKSPSGGVYLSAVLRPEMSLTQLAPLPLVVALGVARGLESLGVETKLKWPNDVWCGGGKLAGVLLEASAEADRAEWVVVGVGINVRRPQDAFEGAAYLDDDGVIGTRGASDVLLADVAARVLDGIARAYGVFVAAGFDALVSEYEQRSMLVGLEVRVSHADGALVAEGTVVGTDALGRLLVREAACDGAPQAEPRAVSAGDVTLRREITG